MIMLFTMAIFLYSGNISQAQSTQKSLDATKICLEVSSTISSFAALGGNSTHTFKLPPYLNGNAYNIWIVSNASIVEVNNSGTLVACRIPSMNIKNSSNGTLFNLAQNATILNNDGVVTVVP
jgi:hypothetical protein